MSCRNFKAIVLWSKEKKVGIENLSNVPENSRFVGAVTPVQFHGDKKFYPAKVLFISGDKDQINSKVEEVEKAIEKAKAEEKEKLPKKRNARSTKNPSAATEQAVAKAIGMRAPVPKILESKHKETLATSKNAKVQKIATKNNLDENVMNIVRKTLFPASESQSVLEPSKSVRDVELEDCDEGSKVGSDDESEGGNESDSQSENAGNLDKHWCSCPLCKVMKKYDAPIYLNFLRDITAYYERGNSNEVKYLELLPIDPKEKKVELVVGSKVYISASVRDQLKVDFRNKPSSLVRETLFALYGRDTFKILNITGKGCKKGSYAIPKNVEEEHKMKSNALVKLINKRAPEWRKSPSPKKKKASMKKAKGTSKVSSTSPFKVTVLDSPLGSPAKSTASVHSPFKMTEHPTTARELAVTTPTKLTKSPSKPLAKSSAKLPTKSPLKSPFKVTVDPPQQPSASCSTWNEGGYGSTGYQHYAYPHKWGHDQTWNQNQYDSQHQQQQWSWNPNNSVFEMNGPSYHTL